MTHKFKKKFFFFFFFFLGGGHICANYWGGGTAPRAPPPIPTALSKMDGVWCLLYQAQLKNFKDG